MLDDSSTRIADLAPAALNCEEWIAPPPAPAATADAWRDRLWRHFVTGIDAVLRACYGISEFTDDPECLIRVAMSQACCDLALADGTVVRTGDPILVLHLWNEHVVRFSGGRPSLGWASRMRRRVSQSLEALAEQIESEPAWREVRAVRADTALFGLWRMYQARGVIRRFGFDLMPPPRHSALRALQALGDACIVWMLTRAFNPAALRRHGFLRGRHEMWMSRHRLLARYGPAPLTDQGAAIPRLASCPASH